MVRRQQQADRALRPAMRSPGRPMPARHVEREFWRLIAQGHSTEKAAFEIGVSVPVGSRWFRHAGGMPPLRLAEPAGRYLSFQEREELALLKARNLGVSMRSPGSCTEIPARSHASCAVTLPPGAANSITALRWRSGKRRRQLGAPNRRSW